MAKESWQRQKGESAQAYEAAKLYFELRAERSLAAVRQKLGKSKALIERWSRRWNWPERARDYDEHADEFREDELQKSRAKEAQIWIERDRELRERFFQLGEVIVAKAERMVREFPERSITRHESHEGKAVTINVRPNHTLQGLAQILGVGAELQRLAVGIHPGSTPLDNLDLDGLSRDELLALLRGEQVKLPEEKKK